MRTLVVLKAARATIEDPVHWVKGRFSRMVNDRVCYCAVGAVAETLGNVDGGSVTLSLELTKVLETLAQALPPSTARPSTAPVHRLTAFNDSSTHAQVLALFDRAIAAL